MPAKQTASVAAHAARSCMRARDLRFFFASKSVDAKGALSDRGLAPSWKPVKMRT